MVRNALFALFVIIAVGSRLVADNLMLGGSGSPGTWEKRDDNSNLVSQGNLSIPRQSHAAVKLSSGSLFVAGGTQDSGSWQILDQSANVLSSGSLHDPREGGGAILLSNGNVFIAGGVRAGATWDIYTPTGALAASGNLAAVRQSGFRVLALQDGNIWISGAEFGTSQAGVYEIHDINGNLVATGNLTIKYWGGQAKVLPNGNVFLLGGDSCPTCFEVRTQTGVLVSSGTISMPFDSGAGSALLMNGNIFLFGGSCAHTAFCGPGIWQIIDSSGNNVANGDLAAPRSGATVSVLVNGNVLIAAGSRAPEQWEIWSSAGSFISQGLLAQPRNVGSTNTHF